MDYCCNVKVYDEEIFVNSKTGQGFDRVLAKMSGVVGKYASTLRSSYKDFDDFKQDLNIVLLEGIKNFDPSKNVKMSTFLETHIYNKNIEMIKSSKKIKHHANFLSKTKSMKADGIKNAAFRDIHWELPISSFSGKYDDEVNLYDLIESSPFSGSFCSGEHLDMLHGVTTMLERTDPVTREIIIDLMKGFSISEITKNKKIRYAVVAEMLSKFAKKNDLTF